MGDQSIVISKRFDTIVILILIMLMMVRVSNTKDEYANLDRTDLKDLHSSNNQDNISDSEIANEAENKNNLTSNITSSTTVSF